jgi:hypothetical protein
VQAWNSSSSAHSQLKISHDQHPVPLRGRAPERRLRFAQQPGEVDLGRAEHGDHALDKVLHQLDRWLHYRRLSVRARQRL